MITIKSPREVELLRIAGNVVYKTHQYLKPFIKEGITTEELNKLGIYNVDAVLFDLGVSSPQLDDSSRGFSFHQDAKLDMRMDNRNPLTAKDIVNTYSEMELFRIIRDYGEDRFAKNIAKHIVMAREQAPITTTGELTEIIKRAIPMKVRMTGGHPSKRTFPYPKIYTSFHIHEFDDLLLLNL